MSELAGTAQPSHRAKNGFAAQNHACGVAAIAKLRGLLIGARYKISSDSVQEGGADRGVEGATVSRDDEYRCCHPRCKEGEGNPAVPTTVEMNQGNTDENTKTSEA